MPNFLIHNGTISQSGSKMEQCNSLLPRHPCPFCCHLPWFMVVEKCHQFNQYLWCHTIDAKRRKSQKSQVRQRREKRNLDTLYDGQVNSNRLSAQTMGTPYHHTITKTNSGSSLRLLAISIIFVNYMVEDLVVEWMWLDAIYEFCGGEVTTDTRMKMRRDIRLKHKTDFYFIPGWTFSCSLRNHLRWEWWDDYTNQGNYEDVALLNCTRKQIIHLVLIKIFLTGNDTSIHDAYSESFFYTNGSSVDYM